MTDTRRPNPDALLARVNAEAARAERGHLKIFFGMAAGVGKTYAMLQAARQQAADGVDVVIGYVEPHGRVETEALLEGLICIPSRQVPYRGRLLREFDLDATLARSPQLALVDELAHSNAFGSRHTKRWQDINELLAAGINVYTTVNVQHLESLNDVVAQMTGVRVNETLPDHVFDEADEVALIDLPADELINRLQEGKVYLPEQAERATRHFFKKGNLLALRELALRRTADRVDEDMRDFRGEHSDGLWRANECLLIGIAPDGNAANVVRAGKRLADRLRAEWLVAFVDTPHTRTLPPDARQQIERALHIAESLGAEALTLDGNDSGKTLVELAQSRAVTRIVLGKPQKFSWWCSFRPSVANTVVREAHNIDIHFVAIADPTLSASDYFARSRRFLGLDTQETRPTVPWQDYGYALAITALITLFNMIIQRYVERANLTMLYLAGVVSIAYKWGRAPSVLASFCSVLVFDFFFVPPYWSFAVSDSQYLLTFAAMLAVALTVSSLTASIRLHAEGAGARERRTAALYRMSREISSSRGKDNIINIAVRHVAQVFDGQSIILLPNEHGRLVYPQGSSGNYSLHGADLGVAQWVLDRDQPAGLGTQTLVAHEAAYWPLTTGGHTLGVLALLPLSANALRDPQQQRLLETFCSLTAQALERVSLAHDAQMAEIEVEAERLRNALLAAISHDLRTPLAGLIGTATALADPQLNDPDRRCELAQTIHQQAMRVNGLVDNVLDMARLSAGPLALNIEWQPLEEVIGSALAALQWQLGMRTVHINLPVTLPLLCFDSVLIERVLINLLENASKYTPSDATLTLSATQDGDSVVINIQDNGPGLPSGDPAQLFVPFRRGQRESATPGIGLGLTICRAIIEAHGGRVCAENALSGGAIFHFSLSIGHPPSAPVDI